MGHSNSASWITVLEKMEKFDVEIVCPGHGPVTTKDVLGKQKKYFADLRDAVKKGLDDKKSLDAITAGIELGWYKQWTGKAAKENKDNVKHVYEELTGKIDHDRIGMSSAPLNWRAKDATVPTTTVRGIPGND